MTPENLLAGFIFGSIGLAAFVYGKRSGGWKAMALGVALMVYPYFIDATWLVVAIGVGLTTGLFVFRD